MPLGCTKSSTTTVMSPVLPSTRKTLCFSCSISPCSDSSPAPDTVGRIGEPDRAIRSDDDGIWRVELLAIVAVGDHCDRAIELCAGDASTRVLASHKASLRIDRVAVG